MKQVLVMYLAIDLLGGDGIITVPGNQMTSDVICTVLSCSLHLCSIQSAMLDVGLGVVKIIYNDAGIILYWGTISSANIKDM